jgi:hypothetical protein
MTRKEAEIQAEEYINKVLASQKALGHKSKLSEAEYRRAVDRAAQAMADLSQPADLPEESEAVPA